MKFSAPAQRGGRGRLGVLGGKAVSGARGRGQPLRGALAQTSRGCPRLVGRGGPLVTGRGQVRGLNMRPRVLPPSRGGMARPGGQFTSQGLRGALPGYGRGLRGPGRGPVRPPGRTLLRPSAPAPDPDPAPLPASLLKLQGVSVTTVRPKPVILPQDLRLPSGITLSHPRGIQNQPPPSRPPSRPHYNPPPAPVPDTERKQKVSLELTAEQIETLRSLGYL